MAEPSKCLSLLGLMFHISPTSRGGGGYVAILHVAPDKGEGSHDTGAHDNNHFDVD